MFLDSIEKNHLDHTLESCRRAFWYLLFFGFVTSFLTLAVSIYSLQVFDRVLSSSSIETLVALTIIVIVFYIISHVIQVIRSSIAHHISQYIDKELASFTINVSFSSLKTNAGFGVNNYIKDLLAIRNFITSSGLISAIDAPWSLIYILVIFSLHFWLGVLIVFGAIGLIILAWINHIVTRSLINRANEAQALSTKELQIIERNVDAIEGMRIKQQVVSNWQDINHKYNQLSSILAHKSNIIINVIKFFRGMIYVFSTAIGAILVIDHQMSSGGIIACSILSSKALMPFDAAVTLWNSLLSTKKSYERLKKLITENFKPALTISLPEPKGKFTLENISYTRTHPEQIIIHSANLKLEPGEVIAITGPSAAGKSTLVKLMVGVLAPTKGTVRLDDASLAHYKDEEMTNYIGYLPQNVELFNGDIKTNIARMNKKAEDKKIIEAAQMAGVHQMILNLNHGYKTDLGNWGAKISPGQRQRIALARAFFGDPKFVVLDEPNSNLDGEGDEALLRCLKIAKQKEITVVVVSHRKYIMDVVDRAFVLHEKTLKQIPTNPSPIKVVSQS